MIIKMIYSLDREVILSTELIQVEINNCGLPTARNSVD